MGKRPVWVASVAFLAGAFFGVVPVRDAALLAATVAFACALFPRVRVAAIALGFGLLRGALHESPLPAPEVVGEFGARVESVEGPRAVLRLDSGALALVRVDGAHRGDQATFFGKLFPPPGVLNPGGRDERRQLGVRGIALAGRAELLEVSRAGPVLWRRLDELRAGFTRRAEIICQDRDRAALVAALAVGDRSLLSPDTEDDLAASGLVHLLASSGLHLAVVAFLARAAGRRLWLLGPWAPLARASVAGAACAVPLVIAEVFLLGAPWPAVRAGFAALLALVAAGLSRRPEGLTLLAIGSSTCAAIDPAATHDLALQLSVAGILGLLVLARPLRERLPLRKGRLEPIVRLGCATAAATLCTAPLIAASFHRVSLVSVAANALALWPGLAAIPVATALIALDWSVLWFAADALAGLTLAASRLFASVPLATVRVAAPGLLACALWYCGTLLVAARRRRSLVAFTLACLLLVRVPPTKLRLTFLAAGQGDATIVQFPGGGAMLIDGGGDLRWPVKSDPGARVVLPALAELGIARLDVVVLTHPHPDHAGGLLTVLDRIDVRELWMLPSEDPIARAVRARALGRGIRVVEPHDRIFGGVSVEVVSRPHPSWSLNDGSIVLRLRDREARALLPGDVEALAESELAQQDVRAQLLKAPHHGSRTSSTDAFLRAVRPEQVVYELGARNSFGFPHPEVVRRTEALGARTFRTDHGAVLAESDGTGFRVSVFEP